MNYIRYIYIYYFIKLHLYIYIYTSWHFFGLEFSHVNGTIEWTYQPFPNHPFRQTGTEALRESSGSLLSLLKAKLPALIRLLEHVLAGFRVVPRKFQIETKVKDKFHISKSHPQSHFKRSFSNFPWLAMKFEGCKLWVTEFYGAKKVAVWI